jgi:hypothetical protein
MTPSSWPICDPRPKEMSIKKKITDQKGDAGSSTIACVKMMKARPAGEVTRVFHESMATLNLVKYL